MEIKIGETYHVAKIVFNTFPSCLKLSCTLRTTTIRHVVSFIDFYFHVSKLVFFAARVRTTREKLLVPRVG